MSLDRTFPFGLITFVATLLLLSPGARAQSIGLVALLDGIQEKLEDMDDMSADFLQIHEDSLNETIQEEGHLYLRRPRMMRWEYRTPEEKLFVTDGETVYLYLPNEAQVKRDRAGDTYDDRIPIMFLLGRSDLESEFTSIALNPAGILPRVPGAAVLRMYPRRESDVNEVVLDVDPVTFDIRRVRMTYVDDSVMEFVFDRIETNSDLDRSLFEFVPPDGTEVVEGIAQ
jgi:outer membrane lipoprotein carrier protein